MHGEDQELVATGALGWRDLVTIRPGEPTYDQLRGMVLPAAQEFIKLAGGRATWSCKFYEKSIGCGIYGRRPLECRLLLCRDTGPLEAVMGRDLLGRRDFLASAEPVLPLLERLEHEVGYAEIGALLPGPLNRSAADVNLARLTGLVRTDLAIRAEFLRNFAHRSAEELFLLGRPLFLVIAPYGFRVVEGPDGVELTMSNS